MKPFRKLAFFCAAASLSVLAACQQSEAPAPDVTEAASNGPDAKPGISASQGRLVLPVVAGRPAAAYFSLRNDGDKTARLVSVYIVGAPKSEMHKTEGGKMSAVEEVEIAPGQSVEFAPGGLHVMAFEVTDLIDAGETTEMTLSFSDGDKLSMPLAVETMGDAMGGMQH